MTVVEVADFPALTGTDTMAFAILAVHGCKEMVRDTLLCSARACGVRLGRVGYGVAGAYLWAEAEIVEAA